MLTSSNGKYVTLDIHYNGQTYVADVAVREIVTRDPHWLQIVNRAHVTDVEMWPFKTLDECVRAIRNGTLLEGKLTKGARDMMAAYLFEHIKTNY
jgi:hypothetical protein